MTNILEGISTNLIFDVPNRLVSFEHTCPLESVQESLQEKGFDSEVFIKPKSLSRKEILSILVAVETNSTHPLANAIKQAALLEGISSVDIGVMELENIAGEGVKGLLADGRVVHVGNFRMANRFRCPQKNIEEKNVFSEHSAYEWGQELEQQGCTIGFVFVNEEMVGVFSAADTIREEASAALSKLKKMKVTAVMLTGDNVGSAKRVQENLNANEKLISECYAGLLPEEKVQWIKNLREVKEHKVVAMIGDGVNDAPALAVASVGMAMGAKGSPLALETADVAIMNDDLSKLPRILALGRATRMKIIQNLIFSLVSKVLMIILALLGYVTLGAAIGVDVGAMLLVTLNGVSLLSIQKNTVSPMQNVAVV